MGNRSLFHDAWPERAGSSEEHDAASDGHELYEAEPDTECVLYAGYE